MNKIAILISSLKRGGAERVTVRLAEYFVKMGIQCDIITLHNPSKNEYLIPNGVKRLCNGGNSIVKLRHRIKCSAPDLLLVMDTPLCMFAIPACMGLKIKTVVSERNAPAQFSGKKITKYLSRFFMKYADGFVFQTEEAKRFYNKKINGRGKVIPNPLFTSDIPNPYTGTREKTIVAVGRLVQQKNHSLLIDAFDRIKTDFPDYKVIIYGEGTLRQELEKKIADLDLIDRIELQGNKSNVLELIRKSSLFVMPSDFEGMPNALIEALALGLPCISTDCPCGGPAYLIKNDINGVLVPTRDVNALENALRDLLSHPEKASRLARQAVEVRSELDIAAVGKLWLEYLKEIALQQ